MITLNKIWFGSFSEKKKRKGNKKEVTRQIRESTPKVPEITVLKVYKKEFNYGEVFRNLSWAI